MNRELQLIKHFNLETGDRIVIPKSLLGLVQHQALYLEYNEFGQYHICKNVIGKDVKLTSVNDFFHNVKSVVQRTSSRLRKPYSLINYNWESFCNNIQHSIIKSRQVSIGLFVSFVKLMLAVLNSDYGK